LAENQIGISSESGDNMASRNGRDMIANFKARRAFAGARHEAFIVRVKEGLLRDLIGWHEVGERFRMGVCGHGEKMMERWNRTTRRA
jgi:hypothetical protein